MFKSIINSIAKSIVKATTTSGQLGATAEEVKAQPKTLTIPMGVGTRKTVGHSAVAPESMRTGKFYPDHLELLSSTYLRDSIAGLGAWGALAKAFNAYAKMQNRRNADPTAYEQAKEEFHIWNSATSCDKQMNEEQVIIALDKIAEVNVPQGNAQTDAIIARVLNKDIEQVKQDRVLKAAKQTEQRKGMLAHLCADIWQFSGEDVDCFLSSAKVASKGIQTLEFIATYWQGRPEAIAAELLLIEDDMKVIEELANREEDHDGENTL